ncbi:MAG: hypothetical protein K9K88_04055 [Desulfobacterales bacterium]|nr:hypothetical protein [Desulfobacterales bacterium]
MSGIAGIANKDGSPVDPRLLQQWVEFLRFRGPDGGQLWSNGPVGLANTLLDTTGSALAAHQPCSLDGKVWISADARIDGQQELKAKLQKDVADELAHATDAKLILYAYHKWDQRCLDHLIGDFSFAIWDNAKQRLFCARDHFGVKPFFYADTFRHFLFSNTLNCLRLHPEVSSDLDDRAIADFLIYGMLVHLDRSAFSDIRRLPPAHCLIWSAEKGLDVRRYWTLPLPDLLTYKHRQDYFDHFNELMQRAVDDRLRTTRVIVSMSGGLDSTSVAAFACESEAFRKEFTKIHAGTGFYRRLVPDDEHQYARLAAEKLGMPFHGVQMDEAVNDPWIGKWFRTPEPIDDMVPLGPYRRTCMLAKNFRVVLTGQGGDPALYPAPASFPLFMQKLFLGSLGLRILKYKFTVGRFPRLDLRKSFRRYIGRDKKSDGCPVPPWINRDFFSHVKSDPRWVSLRKSTKRVESLRGGAYLQMEDSMWPNIFENGDSGVTSIPAQERHPYFDLRVINFLLALPPVPWCVDKHLIRQAMKNRLPRAVLKRPKTPLKGLSDYERLREGNTLSLHGRDLNARLAEYIDVSRYRSMMAAPEKLHPIEFKLITRPIFFSQWLNHIDSKPFKPGGA